MIQANIKYTGRKMLAGPHYAKASCGRHLAKLKILKQELLINLPAHSQIAPGELYH